VERYACVQLETDQYLPLQPKPAVREEVAENRLAGNGLETGQPVQGHEKERVWR